MSRLDQDREDLIHLIISICDYARLGYKVSTYNNCNSCKAKECKYRSDWGDSVRWNCPLWKAEEVKTVYPKAKEESWIPWWIPCNKRLPKGRELVNVSCHDDSGDTSYDYSSCGWVTDDGEYWIVDNEVNSHVVAWMPLPKPYEGESNYD